ncbi:MAG: molybdopterin-dependent oxidoreductase [Coriobacteriaceae bacterium]|nr:molybdopterin-dependent oxidoreductase [Coriobacteriaceae bacterium]
MKRRTFLKLAGSACATALAAQVLIGCQKKETEPEVVAPVDDGQPDYDSITRTVCAPNCVGSCGINAFVKNDTIIKVEPADFPDNAYHRICARGISNAMQRVYSPDRVKYPMKRVGERGSGEWERISWEAAIDLIHEKMQYNIDNYGPQSNAWLGMTGNYSAVVQLYASMMAMTYEGTAFTSFGIMADNACNMGFLPPTGVQQDASEWEDMMGSKSIIMFGCNYAETNMQEMHFLFDAQEAGAKVIVVDPRLSRTASKADWWIPIRPGTDAALICGLMNYVVENKKYDEQIIRTYTVGAFLVDTATGKFVRSGEDYVVWDESTKAIATVKALPDEAKPAYPSVAVAGDVPADAEVPSTAALLGSFSVTVKDVTYAAKPSFQLLVESLAEYTPDKASAICEVPAQDIIKFAEIYLNETPARLHISQGTNRYWNGHLPTRAAVQLAAICGNVGKPHANINWAGGTLMKILFGVGLSAVQPYAEHFSSTLPGTQWMDIVATQSPYPVKLMWFNAYGWGTQSPELNYLKEEVLPQLNFVIVSEQMMNAGAELADLVLPICSYYEEPFDVVTAWSSMWVQVREQAISQMYESKTDYQIGQMLAEKFGILDKSEWKLDIKDYYRQHIIAENNAPEFSSIDFDELVEKKVVKANYPEPYVAFESLRFNTPSGKMELYAENLVEFGEQLACHYEPLEGNRSTKAEQYPLTFMNCRTVFTTHSQHVNLDWIRELMPEPWLEISPEDASARGIATGDVVEVYNDRGSYKVKALITAEIKPGCINQRQGWWPKHFVEGHYGSLLHMELNPAQDAISETNFAPYDNLVQVKKA